jgi:hypothetical protein
MTTGGEKIGRGEWQEEEIKEKIDKRSGGREERFVTCFSVALCPTHITHLSLSLSLSHTVLSP